MAGKSTYKLVASVFLLLAMTTLGGCLSNKIVTGRRDFYAGNYAASARVLSTVAEKNGKDKILAMLELGAALQADGKYKESTEVFLEANSLIEANDIISIGQKAKSAATNKMMTTYQPESFEKVLVHTYLQINYMMMDKWSEARVEAKKALEILDKLGDPELTAQPFTRYVCGLSFEVMGDIADAYIEYAKVVEADPDYSLLYYDLYRIAMQRGMRPDADKWAQQIISHGGAVPKDLTPPNLIIFVLSGRAPVKRQMDLILPPSFNRFVVPVYETSGSVSHHAMLKTDNYSAISFNLTDLDPIAKKTLKKRIAKEIAAETARVAAKELIAQQIEQQNALAGLGVRAVFWASEKADTRSWETLPRYLGVITATLSPGTYNVSLEYYAQNNAPVSMPLQNTITVSSGRRTVLLVRSLQ